MLLYNMDTKDHQIGELVNEITANVKRICPEAPQQLRSVIASSVVSDIKGHMEDQKKRMVEAKLEELLYCCDSMHEEWASSNFGNARDMLRHVCMAYERYKETVDEFI